MADGEKRGFFSTIWQGVSYPFRSDGLGADIADSSLFPFTRQRELLARPASNPLSASEKKELTELSRQTETAARGGSGVLAVAAENISEGALNVAGAALKPIVAPFKGVLDFVSDNWKSVLIGAVAVSAAIFTGGGFLGFAALAGAALFVGNEVSQSTTGKGLLDHAKGLITPEKPAAVTRSSAPVATSREVTQVERTSTEAEKPSPGLPGHENWVQAVGARPQAGKIAETLQRGNNGLEH